MINQRTVPPGERIQRARDDRGQEQEGEVSGVVRDAQSGSRWAIALYVAYL